MGRGGQPENRLAQAHYQDAGLYDKRYGRRRDDVAFYRTWAKRARQVLELGAGTGRLTVPMLASGARVTALEREVALLPTLRERAPSAHIVRGDFTRKLPPGAFALVVAPFNALSHVHHDLLAVLQRIRAQTSGHFVFDVPMPDPEAMRRDPERKFRVGYSTVEGVRYAYSESFDYDAEKQTMLTLAHYDVGGDPAHPKSFVLPLLHRLYFPQELRTLVTLAGFKVVSHTGDFSGAPLTRESLSQVIVAR